MDLVLGLYLIAEVDVAGRFLALGGEPVAAAEVTQLRRGNTKLVRDPRIGPALTNPGSDLVELWSQGLAGHGGGL